MTVIAMMIAGWASAEARTSQEDAVVDRLLGEPRVAAARQAVRTAEPQTIATQISICEVPAPPFEETARARVVEALFHEAGLERVRIDEAGNVVGERAGDGPTPHVVLSAHLDTVFPRGTKVTVRRAGRVLVGPGIGDDCRGLAVLVAVARVLTQSRISTDGPITFVATVGEEGLGDLRGVRHLFDSRPEGSIDRFLSLDGGGLGIVSRAVGSQRYRVTFAGPGGHSYGSFGMANPIHAVGRAIAAIADLHVPSDPKTTFNVGRIGGGTSVNAIASEAWMEVDLRSSDANALSELDRAFRAAVERAAADENARWGGRAPVTVTVTRTGSRPTGATDRHDVLIRRALGITEALGTAVTLSEGSTDANLPMSRRVPALTMGAGGDSRQAHAPGESFDTTGSSIGTERALLLVLAAASRDR
jgi:tripeptide aminopeptidase